MESAIPLRNRHFRPCFTSLAGEPPPSRWRGAAKPHEVKCDFVRLGGVGWELLLKESNRIYKLDGTSNEIQMYDGLCHALALFHRDLKPENLLFTFRENTDHILVTSITDFGLCWYALAQRIPSVLHTVVIIVGTECVFFSCILVHV